MIEIRRARPEELESLYVIECTCFDEDARWDEPRFVKELARSDVWVAEHHEFAGQYSGNGTCQSVAHSHPCYMLHGKSLECVDWVETGSRSEVVAFLVGCTYRGAGHITSIDVLPDWQRKGIGAKLLDAAAENYRGLGYPHIMLEVDVNNPAQTLYFKLGYRAKLVRPKYYSNGHDCLVMHLPLTADSVPPTIEQ